MEGQKKKRDMLPTLVYAVLGVAIVIILGFVIQICNTEKVQVCDLTTGKCDLESSCQPLWAKLLSTIR